MSDSNLRELERRFKETGSAEDEAAWLRERVRVGDVPPGRLRLAAWLSNPAASLALGAEAPVKYEDLGDYEREVLERLSVQHPPAGECLVCGGPDNMIPLLVFAVMVGLGVGGVVEPWDTASARIGLVAVAVFTLAYPSLSDRVFKSRLASVTATE